MSDQAAASSVDDSERLIRIVCFGGLLALPALTLFVHLLLIYRS